MTECLTAALTPMAKYSEEWEQQVAETKLGDGAMAIKVGDVVQLKSGSAQMIVSKLFKSPEGREMAFVIDSLEEAGLRTAKRKRCAD